MFITQYLSALTEDFNANKSQLKEHITGAFYFDLVMGTLSPDKEKQKVVFDEMKGELASFSDSGHNVNKIICFLTTDQMQEFLLTIDLSKVFISDRDTFDLFRHLGTEQTRVLAEHLVAHNFSLSLNVVGEMLRENSEECFSIILRTFKTQLPGLFNSVRDLLEVTRYFSDDAKRDIYFKEMFSVLKLSLIVKEDDFYRLFQTSAENQVSIAQQAGEIFDSVVTFSARTFKNIIPFHLRNNQPALDLLYQGAISALPKLLDPEKSEEGSVADVGYFMEELCFTSSAVQNQVWVALNEYLPKIITNSNDLFGLLHHTGHWKPDAQKRLILMLPALFEPDHVRCFNQSEQRLMSLVAELYGYIRQRGENTNEYYHFGLFKLFGAQSRQSELNAANALINVILDPEHNLLDPKYVVQLGKGGLSQVVAKWCKLNSTNPGELLRSFQNPLAETSSLGATLQG